MKYAIVYSSRTGNTELLAQRLRDSLPKEDCLYVGPPTRRRWQRKSCMWVSGRIKEPVMNRLPPFLRSITHQQVFLFGTAGFGGAPEYFEKILTAVKENLSETATVTGSYMCQGKMPVSVRKRYESMEESAGRQAMLDNFDRALSHPDEQDFFRFGGSSQTINNKKKPRIPFGTEAFWLGLHDKKYLTKKTACRSVLLFQFQSVLKGFPDSFCYSVVAMGVRVKSNGVNQRKIQVIPFHNVFRLL